MGHLNIISFFWIIILIFYSRYVIRQKETTRSRFLKIQLLIILVYSIGIVIIFPRRIPVELSTVAYFIVPIIVLFNLSGLKAWGVYSSIISGVIYFAAMIILGNYLYEDYPAYGVYAAIYNHGALLSYAYITLSTTKIRKSERMVIWIGIIFSATWALLLRPFVIYDARVFIYDVDGLFVRTYFSENLTFGYIIYYILFVITLFISANIVHLLNQKLYKDT